MSAWKDVQAEVETRDVTWRDAAYLVALSRLVDAHANRGLWPCPVEAERIHAPLDSPPSTTWIVG